MPGLSEQVEDSICRQQLLRSGQPILVAVSGGLDSMVLLHLLRSLSQKYRWRLSVAHLNHQLRGASSLADERLVKRTAAQWRLPCLVERAPVKDLAAESGESLEMTARRVRHDFLVRAARQSRARTIALAHHADDQVELFFLRLLRGAGAEGVSGMKWHNASPVSSRVRLVRPLLEQTRAAIRAYASEHRIPFREDASNACLDIQRNRIRHELLPLLRRHYQPGLDRAILRGMSILAAESDFVSDCARLWLKTRQGGPKGKRGASSKSAARSADGDGEGKPLFAGSTAFEALPLALQRRVLQIQLLDQQIIAGFDLIEFLRQNPGKPTTIGQAVRARAAQSGHKGQLLAIDNEVFAIRKADGAIEIRQKASIASPSSGPRKLDLATRGSVEYGGLRLECQVVVHEGVERYGFGQSREFFDADRVGQSIILRHWQPGDRFCPIGMKRSVKLQDLFTNLKIPRERRGELVVAVAEGGEIFWVEGIRISERFKLTKGTKRCLQWVWRRF